MCARVDHCIVDVRFAGNRKREEQMVKLGLFEFYETVLFALSGDVFWVSEEYCGRFGLEN